MLMLVYSSFRSGLCYDGRNIQSDTWNTVTGSAQTCPPALLVVASGQSLLELDSQFRTESIQKSKDKQTHTCAHAAQWAHAFQLWNK